MMIVEKMLNNAPNPLLHIADVSGSAFLLDALKCLEYKTPNSILEFMDKQKFNCIIQNPPYELCEGIK